MKSLNIIGIFISLVVAGCGYFLTEQISIFCVTLILFSLTFILLINPKINRYYNGSRKRHESYKFINSFIVNLSVTNSLEKAFKAGSEGQGEEFNKLIKSLEDNPRGNTFYLQNYFESNAYQMFLNIFSVYELQGGDIITLSRNLLLEVSRIEEASLVEEKDSAHCLKEYLTMWAFALVIFVFMRFGLSSFFDYLKGNIVFVCGVCIFLGFFLISNTLYFSFFERKSVSKSPFNKIQDSCRKGVKL